MPDLNYTRTGDSLTVVNGNGSWHGIPRPPDDDPQTVSLWLRFPDNSEGLQCLMLYDFGSDTWSKLEEIPASPTE